MLCSFWMRQIFREEGETEEVGSQAMKLIRNIVRYLDKDAKDIMTHRRDIVGIDEEETLETALKFMLGERFSRFPVYREDIDEIIGTIHLRDAMTCYFTEANRNRPIISFSLCLSIVLICSNRITESFMI